VSLRAWCLLAGRWVGCGMLGAALVAAPVSAQTPSGTQDLTFGTVLPGVPTVVARTDAARAGRLGIRGTRRAEVAVDFVLPAAMTGGAGASMPLVFGANDGGQSTNNNIAAATPFDPRATLVTRLGNSGRLYIFLGGTVQPTSQQRSGTYAATIAMNVAYTGN